MIGRLDQLDNEAQGGHEELDMPAAVGDGGLWLRHLGGPAGLQPRRAGGKVRDAIGDVVEDRPAALERGYTGLWSSSGSRSS